VSNLFYPQVLDTRLVLYRRSSALAQAEYLGLVSAFYNAEFVASTLMTQVVLRSECNARLASDALTVTGSPKPRVMWAYLYFGAWHVGYCPDYYCVALSQAGGDMILSPIPDVNFQGINHTVMTSLIRNADVWLYASDNWDAEVAPSLPGRAAPNPPTESVAAVLAAAPAVANRTVYDFLRAGEDAWFEVREAEPDALLQVRYTRHEADTSLISQLIAGLSVPYSPRGADRAARAVRRRYRPQHRPPCLLAQRVHRDCRH
jgi:hypothetical protein